MDKAGTWCTIKGKKQSHMKGKKEPLSLEMYTQWMFSLENEGKIKSFSDKLKLTKCVASRQALQKILKEIIQAEGKVS